MTTAVRRVRADEWPLVRDLRLAALADPDAGIAFYGSLERARMQPDDFWRRRTERVATDPRDAQFVAIVDDAWVGTATVLVRDADASPHVDIVAVFVREEHRGTGVIDALMDAAVRWTAEAGFDRVQLTVHVSNTRAQRAYRRAGFAPSGDAVSGPNGLELVLSRPVAR